MKNAILFLILGLSLASCARWDLDKPIDEEREEQHRKKVVPAGITF